MIRLKHPFSLSYHHLIQQHLKETQRIYIFLLQLLLLLQHIAHLPAPEIMNIDSYNDIKERKSSPSKVSSGSTSISSSVSSQSYHERMVFNNNLPNKEVVEPVNSFQLFYKDKSEEINTVSKTTDHKSTGRQQYTSNKILTLNTSIAQHVDNNIINIQLPYNPD